ncbi:hypothetical protein BC940DRAFT_156468 [Gongronella butleri]|nr:hypothetical protein BC940DRAFT_156468 [Gongronella butleri]
MGKYLTVSSRFSFFIFILLARLRPRGARACCLTIPQVICRAVLPRYVVACFFADGIFFLFTKEGNRTIVTW